MKGSKFIYYCVKIVVYIACFYLFVSLMQDIWIKFRERTTTNGVRYRVDDPDGKVLPCMTIHEFSAFKTRDQYCKHLVWGFYYTTEMLRANSFTAEEIFDSKQLMDFKNESKQITMTEMFSIFYGACFTVCINKPVKARELVYIKMRRGRNLRVFVHAPLEERFIVSRTNPFPVKTYIVDTNNRDVFKAEFDISYNEYATIKYKGAPCKDYSVDYETATDFEGFKECAINVFRNFFAANLTCSIAGYIELNSSKFKPVCPDPNSAAASFELMTTFSRNFVQNSGKFGCPMACNISELEVSMRLGHANSAIDPFNKQNFEPDRNFYLALAYDCIEVEEHIESLAYDLSALLAASGGNLGLALGFSCLSILIEAVDILFHHTKVLNFR